MTAVEHYDTDVELVCSSVVLALDCASDCDIFSQFYDFMPGTDTHFADSEM